MDDDPPPSSRTAVSLPNPRNRSWMLAGRAAGAGARLVGPARARGVAAEGAQRRTAAGLAPGAARLRADVKEVGVDGDRRLPHPLPRLQRRVDLGRLPQSLGGAGPRI